jgi:group I intron endonuclease
MNRRQRDAAWTGYKNCTLLWNAIQKYGVDNIKQDILFENDMTGTEASRLEQMCILLFKCNANRFSNPSYGYNLTDGGEGVSGTKRQDEKHMEQVRKMIDGRRGCKLTEEHKNKLRIAHTGLQMGPMSDETKKKIGAANSKENMSEETRIRKSNSKKKKVVATHKITCECIVFDSVDDTAHYFDVRSSTVSRWCNKTRNSTTDYIFDYYLPTTTEREESSNVA